MGSSLVAAWIAHLAFWILLIIGLTFGELRARGTITALAFWILGYVGLPYFPYGEALYLSYVAVLDVALVFIVFKGDLQLT